MAGIGAVIGIGIAFLALGEGIAQVKDAIIKANAPTEEKSAGVEFGVGQTIANAAVSKNLLGPIPTVEFYGISGNNMGKSERNGEKFGEGKEGTSAFRTVKIREHPEYIKISVPGDGNDDVCIAYMLITDAVDSSATTLLYAWNGSIGKFCGLPWYESDAFLPSQARDFQPPCQWFNPKGAGAPQGMSFRLRDMSDSDRDKLVGMGQEYTDKKDTLCSAPARLQYWKTTGEDTCIPKYSPRFPGKTENGTDISETQARFGHTLDKDCKPGEPWNNNDIVFKPPPVLGLDGFGGVSGLAPNPDAVGVGSFGGVQGSIPDPNAVGIGNFGGVQGSIPIADAGKPVTSAGPAQPATTAVVPPPLSTGETAISPDAFCGDDDPTCEFANAASPPAATPATVSPAAAASRLPVAKGGIGVSVIPPGQTAAAAKSKSTVNPILEAAQRGIPGQAKGKAASPVAAVPAAPTAKGKPVPLAANAAVAPTAKAAKSKSTVNPILEAAQRGTQAGGAKGKAAVAASPSGKKATAKATAARPTTLVAKAKATAAGKAKAAKAPGVVNAAVRPVAKQTGSVRNIGGLAKSTVPTAAVGKAAQGKGKAAATSRTTTAKKAGATAAVVPPPARRDLDLQPRSVQLHRRATTPEGVPDKCEDHLTVSDHEVHRRSAEKLCESESSWGPDFVSLRGRKMCDMCSRVVYDLCDETGDGSEAGVVEDCFVLSTRRLRSKLVRRGMEKRYVRVEEWARRS